MKYQPKIQKQLATRIRLMTSEYRIIKQRDNGKKYNLEGKEAKEKKKEIKQLCKQITQNPSVPKMMTINETINDANNAYANFKKVNCNGVDVNVDLILLILDSIKREKYYINYDHVCVCYGKKDFNNDNFSIQMMLANGHEIMKIEYEDDDDERFIWVGNGIVSLKHVISGQNDE